MNYEGDISQLNKTEFTRKPLTQVRQFLSGFQNFEKHLLIH